MAELRLRADQSYAEAGREVLAVRSEGLFGHIAGVLDIEQPEHVHKMRVATRRLRAALEVFALTFPRKQLRPALAEVKALAAALGERRDCDVQLELLDRLGEDAGRSERIAIDAVAAELVREQCVANDNLAKALAHAERAKLERRLRRLAQ